MGWQCGVVLPRQAVTMCVDRVRVGVRIWYQRFYPNRTTLLGRYYVLFMVSLLLQSIRHIVLFLLVLSRHLLHPFQGTDHEFKRLMCDFTWTDTKSTEQLISGRLSILIISFDSMSMHACKDDRCKYFSSITRKDVDITNSITGACRPSEPITRLHIRRDDEVVVIWRHM